MEEWRAPLRWMRRDESQVRPTCPTVSSPIGMAATRFDRLTHSQAIAGDYKVMDATAFALARETSLPIIVFSIAEPGSIGAILRGTGHGTVVAG